MPKGKEAWRDSLRARSETVDYTFEPECEAEPRGKYAPPAHPEIALLRAVTCTQPSVVAALARE